MHGVAGGVHLLDSDKHVALAQAPPTEVTTGEDLPGLRIEISVGELLSPRGTQGKTGQMSRFPERAQDLLVRGPEFRLDLHPRRP